LTFDDIRIGHLLIDQFDDFTILFVFTFDGLWLRKYSLLKNEKLCLIEQIPLKSPTIVEDNWKINQVEFISQTVRRSSQKPKSFPFSSDQIERNSRDNTPISLENSRCTMSPLFHESSLFILDGSILLMESSLSAMHVLNRFLSKTISSVF